MAEQRRTALTARHTTLIATFLVALAACSSSVVESIDEHSNEYIASPVGHHGFGGFDADEQGRRDAGFDAADHVSSPVSITEVPQLIDGVECC